RRDRGAPVSEGLKVTPLDRAVAALQTLKGRLETIERARTEPIAIVGIGCRFPRSRGPAAYWRMLIEGVDAISALAPWRWPGGAPADSGPGMRCAGLLERADIEEFDAAYFGISPREAADMDPQQRLLLEVAIEGLEDAGLPLDSLAGTRGSVFVGIMTEDYREHVMCCTAGLGAYSGTGTDSRFARGRF